MLQHVDRHLAFLSTLFVFLLFFFTLRKSENLTISMKTTPFILIIYIHSPNKQFSKI
ncbi:hypothetical protein HanXRQr2_Chr14g0624901 [Helianthus annuus]|uniref:Uncharacterized protein n=1 Tax=Helianthus annuus TaxID=4232 RepID=A0A9K3E5Q6_HELAN|nr:hypothetical protein HanXRQr2_Chr14g0624901 [Helianthus annuus]KAJ0838857.1 hypothetical protein HanPSC8_Chr14g0599681 [Helianthus annuus]